MNNTFHNVQMSVDVQSPPQHTQNFFSETQTQCHITKSKYWKGIKNLRTYDATQINSGIFPGKK